MSARPAARDAGRAAVIGGGFGGLTAATLLAREGWQVDLFEAADTLGGKAGVGRVDGAAFDTGPSLLTMPEVPAELFARCGEQLAEHVTLRRLAPAFLYRWPDGAELAVHHALDDTLAEVRATFGATAARELRDFLRYAQAIWEASAPAFVRGDAPSIPGMLRMDLRTLASLRHIDATSTMARSIAQRVRDPHLRDLLARYATYNGSDVRVAPATLNCIAWVELGLGGWGVEGGLGALVSAMVGLARRQGVRLHTGAPVSRLLVEGGAVRGVALEGGAEHAADVVVSNADVRHLFEALLPEDLRPQPRPATPSMSGWNAVFRVRRRPGIQHTAHTVLFGAPYVDEFAAIFDRGEITPDPTVYACHQGLAHGRPGWDDADALFVMVNAPDTAAGRIDSEALREQVRARLVADDLVAPDDAVVWERTPEGLGRRFPGSRGALYGAASNSAWAAFRRPANRSPLARGLYIASGSAHPGGGVPLCVLSGMAAARACAEDHRQALRRAG